MSRCLVPLRQHAGPPVVVRVEALELLMRLERDGFRFRTTDTGRLEVAPWPKVSEADRAALRDRRGPRVPQRRRGRGPPAAATVRR